MSDAGRMMAIVSVVDPAVVDAVVDDIFSILSRQIGFVAISDVSVIRRDMFQRPARTDTRGTREACGRAANLPARRFRAAWTGTGNRNASSLIGLLALFLAVGAMLAAVSIFGGGLAGRLT